VDLEKTKPRLRNANVAVSDQGGEIVFLHRIVPGGADQSYGIQVARLAGLPASVLERARTILEFLEKQHVPDAGPPRPIRKVKTGRALQGSLFAALPDPMLEVLRGTDPERLSADEARDLLRQLRALAEA
jgi:DNA mismatch repair protein MutS